MGVHSQTVPIRLEFRFLSVLVLPSPDVTSTTLLNEFISNAKKDDHLTMMLVRLDCRTIKIAVSANASFAINLDFSSQLGYVVV